MIARRGWRKAPSAVISREGGKKPGWGGRRDNNGKEGIRKRPSSCQHGVAADMPDRALAASCVDQRPNKARCRYPHPISIRVHGSQRSRQQKTSQCLLPTREDARARIDPPHRPRNFEAEKISLGRLAGPVPFRFLRRHRPFNSRSILAFGDEACRHPHPPQHITLCAGRSRARNRRLQQIAHALLAPSIPIWVRRWSCQCGVLPGLACRCAGGIALDVEHVVVRSGRLRRARAVSSAPDISFCGGLAEDRAGYFIHIATARRSSSAAARERRTAPRSPNRPSPQYPVSGRRPCPPIPDARASALVAGVARSGPVDLVRVMMSRLASASIRRPDRGGVVIGL